MKKLLKLISLAVIIFSIFYGTVLIANPFQIFRLDPFQHDLISVALHKSKHVESYGVDAEKVEDLYKALRELFGAKSINRTVYVYACRPKYPNGQIGDFIILTGPKWYKAHIEHLKYYGAYKQDEPTGRDVIVYNGMDIVLIHELAHFFYRHMDRYERDEMFARLTEEYINLSLQRTITIEVLNQFINRFEELKKSEAPKSEVKSSTDTKIESNSSTQSHVNQI